MMPRFFTFHLYRSQVLFLVSGLVLCAFFPMRFIYNYFLRIEKKWRSLAHEVEIYSRLAILSTCRSEHCVKSPSIFHEIGFCSAIREERQH